ncbi:amidase [Mycobacterium sp. 3519A]|uniref:amidase n=1 Tax=Mycobacterium sp. 3519A TaxID=2057184 RepID=UPI000C7BD01E|nr:amidase [Mycobacterium sp. 3519A]
MDDITSAWKLDISTVAALIASQSVSPVDLTTMMLGRIAKIDPALQSYVTVLGEQALNDATVAADEIAAGRNRGPLHGIPIAIKDIYDTAGIRTTSCSKVREHHVPTADATTVRKLKEAGAIVLGKVTTHEFAFGFDSAPTKNAWNLDHIPSGSSGGSAAAIAAGLCFAATGSDTGGSIRAPAAANGIVGIKPTYGRVSKAGVTVLSWSLDHTGPMARSVRDLAVLLDVMAGHDASDPHTKDVDVPPYTAGLTGDVAGMRIGVPLNYFTDDVQPAVTEAVEAAIEHFASLGAEIVRVRIDDISGALDCMVAIATAEAAVFHQRALRECPDLFGDETRLLLEAGSAMPASTYINAQRARAVIQSHIAEALREVDLLVTPTQPATAMKVGQSLSRIGAREESVFEMSARFCVPFNLAGLPAASVPCGFDSHGLPIGLQIIGKPFDETTVLRAADAYQRSTDFWTKYPAIAEC